MLKGRPTPPGWIARLASATMATLVTGLFLGYFGTGMFEWNTTYYWVLLGIVFLIGLLAKGQVD